MAKLVKNDKGFKVIKMSIEEANSLGWGIAPNTCICMACNKVINSDIYYPVVLNDTMDKECYEHWYGDTIYYPEDKDYEDRIFNNLKGKLVIEEE